MLTVIYHKKNCPVHGQLPESKIKTEKKTYQGAMFDALEKESSLGREITVIDDLKNLVFSSIG